MPNNQEVEFFWFQCKEPRGYNAKNWGWDLYDDEIPLQHTQVVQQLKERCQVICCHLQNEIMGRFIVLGKDKKYCYVKLEKSWNIKLNEQTQEEIYKTIYKHKDRKYCPINKNYRPNQKTYFILNRAQFEYLCSLKENK